ADRVRGLEQSRLDLRSCLDTLAGEKDGANASVRGMGAAFGETAFFEAVDEPGDVRRVALPRLRQRTHGLRLVGIEREQRVQRARIQSIRRGDSGELLLPLHHERRDEVPRLARDISIKSWI